MPLARINRMRGIVIVDPVVHVGMQALEKAGFRSRNRSDFQGVKGRRVPNRKARPEQSLLARGRTARHAGEGPGSRGMFPRTSVGDDLRCDCSLWLWAPACARATAW